MHVVYCVCSYELMRQCWRYSGKNRPTFFDILRDFESEMSDQFREKSFYFNQDVGDDTASQSDDNDTNPAALEEDLETDHLTKKPSNESSSNRYSPASCTDRSADQRDCLPPSETDDVSRPAAESSDVTDCLLVPAGPRTDSTVVSGLSTRNGRDSGVLSTSVDVDAVQPKDMLRNGHIPYNFVTTAAAHC